MTVTVTASMADDFEKARDLFVQGIAEFEAGRFDAARTAFETSLVLLPGRVSTITNLAATHIQLHAPEAALRLLDQALASQPQDQDAWWQRAMALDALGRHEQMLAALDRFLHLQPDHVQGWLRHAQALQKLERLEPALASYDRALALDPDLPSAWTNRGNLLKDLERPEEAALAFEQALARGADPALNSYFLAAVRGRTVPTAAPAQYVLGLFDNYAETFDTHLVQVLHYKAHTVLVDNLRGLYGTHFKRALDLGCGTGLCGRLLRNITAQLHGVDLSAPMIDKARALDLYDRLVQADLVQHLQSTGQRYDLLLAADVFIYVGDLAPVFAGAARVLEPAGLFCFSVERVQGDADFELKASLRYGQSEGYLRALAAEHGFEVVKTLHHPIRERPAATHRGPVRFPAQALIGPSG